MLTVARAGRRLVAAGERGIVLLSDDDGQRWRQAAVPVQATLTALRFVDERTGWAVGHLGVILKTEDGGERWVRQLDGISAAARIADAARSGDERAQKLAAHFVDEGPDKPFFDVDFADAQNGVAVGAYGIAFATSDGGAHWTPLVGRLPNPKSLHLYAVRWAGGQWVIAGEQGLLLKSADAGGTFSALASPYKGSWFGLVAARSGTLVAYGLRGRVFRSADGGASWQAIDSGVPVSISAGVEVAPGTLALLGQSGDLLISRDDGLQFHKQPAAAALPATGLAVTGDGHLVLSSLRGLRRQSAPSTPPSAR
ncbi:glycosyl hydrolase [Aquincola sp. S2]|uniref:Glycosyl hydrolase n=1 Tax=Pseudaquabacterium terrae TaxID=2732868 RepID=A0ABX2EGK0_9BURK|nr:YCF48-related protein [Aquabacterium terrae]NRF67744.1 glycosyl hydrolase [Aquabacterium terrae]